MSQSASPSRSRAPSSDALTGADRRRYKRYALSLIGRFMRADRHEYACRLVDISVGGASIASPVRPDIGENVVAYVDELGSIEGTVARHLSDGFAIQLKATQHKREKLAARITWLINRHELGQGEERGHARLIPTKNSNQLRLSDDVAFQVTLLDVSLSGANIGTEARPPLGSEVVLGKLRAKVVRHHDRGIGVRFLDIQEPDSLKRTFG